MDRPTYNAPGTWTSLLAAVAWQTGRRSDSGRSPCTYCRQRRGRLRRTIKNKKNNKQQEEQDEQDEQEQQDEQVPVELQGARPGDCRPGVRPLASVGENSAGDVDARGRLQRRQMLHTVDVTQTQVEQVATQVVHLSTTDSVRYRHPYVR